MHLQRTIAGLIALAALVAGCSDDDDTVSTGDDAGETVEDGAAATTAAPAGDGEAAGTTAAPAEGAGDATVVISGFSFGDAPSATAGSPLTVRNDDGVPHTFTADDGSFDTGPISGGETAEVTVGEPGSYPIHCEIHPTMTGTLTVS